MKESGLDACLFVCCFVSLFSVSVEYFRRSSRAVAFDTPLNTSG